MRLLFGCCGLGGEAAVAEGSGSESGVVERKKKTKKSVRRMRSATARLRSLSLDDLSRTLASSGLHAFTLAELKAATRGFSSSHFIGEGGFGPVYKGFLDDRLRPGEIEPQHVAVKYLDADGPQGHREWLAEVVYLGMLSHPHLVKLIGYCCQDEQRMLVYEYMARGSLEHHLFKNLLSSLPWTTRLKIAVGAAKGLAFLHEADTPVIYRDFKASNILLDSVSPTLLLSSPVHRLEMSSSTRGLHGKALRLRPGQGGPTGRRHPRHHPRHGHPRLRRPGVHTHRAPDGEERRVQLRRGSAGAAQWAAERRQAAARAGAAPGGVGPAVPEAAGAAAPRDGPEPGWPVLRQGSAQGRHGRLPLPAQRAQVAPHYARRRRRARAAAAHAQRRARGPLRVHGPISAGRRRQGRGDGGQEVARRLGRAIRGRAADEEPAVRELGGGAQELVPETEQGQRSLRGKLPQGNEIPIDSFVPAV